MTRPATLGVIGSLVVAMPVLVVTVLVGSGSPAPAAAAGTLSGLKAGTVPARYASLVLQAGSLCAAAPPAIIAAQIDQESGWNPNAVSPAGAEGISQFLPSTWAAVAPEGSSPFDPTVAIPTQGKYDCSLATELSTGRDQGLFGDLDLTSLMLAAYNAGVGAVISARGIPQNGQTPGYVANILAMAVTYAASTSAPMAGSFAATEIAAATSQIGVPYAWAGGGYSGPTTGVCAGGAAANDCNIVGFDCSGLVMYAVFQASGGAIRLPHDADAQTRGGTPVDPASMLPGDLISFTNPGESVAHHIGIYLGNNQIIDAPDSGSLVRIDSLTSSYYHSQQWRVVRYR